MGYNEDDDSNDDLTTRPVNGCGHGTHWSKAILQKPFTTHAYCIQWRRMCVPPVGAPAHQKTSSLAGVLKRLSLFSRARTWVFYPLWIPYPHRIVSHSPLTPHHLDLLRCPVRSITCETPRFVPPVSSFYGTIYNYK